MQHSGARKREWSATTTQAVDEKRGSLSGGLTAAEDGDVIEQEMKRLRLAKAEQDDYERRGRRRPLAHDADVDMDMDGDDGDDRNPQQLQLYSPRHDYRPINLTLRECHYLRQLRRFQAERVSYLERRAPTDAAAAAVMHAMQGRRR